MCILITYLDYSVILITNAQLIYVERVTFLLLLVVLLGHVKFLFYLTQC